MKIETSKSVLKVCGVVAMIYGVLEMLLGVMTTAGGGLISAVGSLAEADVPEVAGPLVSTACTCLCRDQPCAYRNQPGHFPR